MIYLKEELYNIDIPINKIQVELYKSFYDEFFRSNFDERKDEYFQVDQMDGYGRVYLNSIDAKITPSYYKGYQEYKEVLTDDSKSIQYFFVVDDNHNFEGGDYTASCDIIFIVDLEKLFNDDLERLDSKIHNLVLSYLEFSPNFNLNSKVTGISNVFNDIDTERIKTTDIQPLHVFKINGTILYRNEKQICNIEKLIKTCQKQTK